MVDFEQVIDADPATFFLLLHFIIASVVYCTQLCVCYYDYVYTEVHRASIGIGCIHTAVVMENLY